MKRALVALCLAWWFAAYTVDRFDAIRGSQDPRFETTRFHGPYATPWLCLKDSLDLEWRSRWRLMTSLCFEDPE